MAVKCELILGGARSGKSRLAEQRALDSGSQDVRYIATATAEDAEMADRIARHRQMRPESWHTVETSGDLAATLRRQAAAERFLLVDCLTLWLAGMLAEPERWARERADLLAALPTLPGRIVLVSNEVGLGIVPDNTLARQFRDEAGRLHQDLAGCCDQVTFVAAGLPLALKSPPA